MAWSKIWKCLLCKHNNFSLNFSQQWCYIDENIFCLNETLPFTQATLLSKTHPLFINWNLIFLNWSFDIRCSFVHCYLHFFQKLLSYLSYLFFLIWNFHRKGMKFIDIKFKDHFSIVWWLYSSCLIFFLKNRRIFTAATFIYYSPNLVFTPLLQAKVFIRLDLCF